MPWVAEVDHTFVGVDLADHHTVIASLVATHGFVALLLLRIPVLPGVDVQHDAAPFLQGGREVVHRARLDGGRDPVLFEQVRRSVDGHAVLDLAVEEVAVVLGHLDKCFFALDVFAAVFRNDLGDTGRHAGAVHGLLEPVFGVFVRVAAADPVRRFRGLVRRSRILIGPQFGQHRLEFIECAGVVGRRRCRAVLRAVFGIAFTHGCSLRSDPMSIGSASGLECSRDERTRHVGRPGSSQPGARVLRVRVSTL